MKYLASFFCALLPLSTACFSQTNPNKVPQPPTAELSKFDPFLGKYEVSGDFANLPWTGTLELKKAIKGWYIEQTILVKSPGIDREFWLLMTWDGSQKKYPAWGFQTLPNTINGDVRFEGDEMITEWASAAPDGTNITASNRYRFVSSNELEIISCLQKPNGPQERIGYLKGTRIAATAGQPVASFESGKETSMQDATTNSAESDLRALLAERRKASVDGDLQTIASSMADEYLQTDISGYVQDKPTWLREYFEPLADLIKAGKFHWDRYDLNDVQIRIFGDSAVIIGSLELKGTGARPTPQHSWTADPNSTLNANLRFTHAYVRRNGKWLLASLQNAVPLSSAARLGIKSKSSQEQ